MKKITVLSMGMCAVLALASCGTSKESAYKKAYEKAQQQEQQAQRRDHHRPAHGDQRYAADRAQGAQHLPPGDALMQNQHVHQDAAHRHRRDDGPRHS